MGRRAEWLSADDAALLRQCAVDTYRASGPGGQKRNKTDSAVRLRHEPSGLAVIAEESRSQHENKAKALRRLRAAIALHVRENYDGVAPPPELVTRSLDAQGRLRIGRRHEDYWPLMAVVLDAVAAAGGEIRKAAAFMGLSTSRMSAIVTGEEKVMAEVNRMRREAGLKALNA